MKADPVAFRAEDPFGLQRVIEPKGAFPLAARRLDPMLPIAEDELEIELEAIRIDSAALRRLEEECGHDSALIQERVLARVAEEGRFREPVSGQGGMFTGRVRRTGPKVDCGEEPLRPGDRIVSLASLAVTPLELRRFRGFDARTGIGEVEGRAILATYATGSVARIPMTLSSALALAMIGAAGAATQARKLVQPGQVVVVVGAGGFSGLVALHEAKRKTGTKTVAIDLSTEAVRRLSLLPFVDEVIQADATDALDVMNKTWNATKGHFGDVVFNCANEAGTEMATLLAARRPGTLCFLNVASSLSAIALGAECLASDLDIRVGYGGAGGAAEAVSALAASPELLACFTQRLASG